VELLCGLRPRDSALTESSDNRGGDNPGAPTRRWPKQPDLSPCHRMTGGAIWICVDLECLHGAYTAAENKKDLEDFSSKSLNFLVAGARFERWLTPLRIRLCRDSSQTHPG
jgi:hypothetical protein